MIWLARLSFSFLILAFVLGWEAYQLAQAGGERTRLVLLAAGALVCLLLGLAGVRERHR